MRSIRAGGTIWAYGSVVERGIRIAETAVRFCLGPQEKCDKYQICID